MYSRSYGSADGESGPKEAHAFTAATAATATNLIFFIVFSFLQGCHQKRGDHECLSSALNAMPVIRKARPPA